MKLKYLISFLTGFTISSMIMYIPVFASSLGMSYNFIGVIVAFYAIASGLSFYYFGRFSDLRAIRKVLVCTGLLLMFIFGIAHYFMTDIFTLLLIRTLFGIAAGIYTGPMIAYMVAGDTRVQLSIFFGFGSLGWAAGVFAAGFLASFFSYTQLFVISSVPLLFAFLVSIKLKDEQLQKIEIPFLPLKIIRKNLYAYSSFLIRNIAAQAIWVTYPIYILSLGASNLMLGFIYGLNPLTQFFVMNVLSKFSVTSRKMMKLGLALSTAAFFMIGVAMQPYQLLFVAVVIGLSWSFLFLGTNLYLVEHNVEKATVTGLLQSSISLSLIIGSLIGGYISHLFGIRAMILAMAGVALFSLVVELLFEKGANHK